MGRHAANRPWHLPQPSSSHAPPPFLLRRIGADPSPRPSRLLAPLAQRLPRPSAPPHRPPERRRRAATARRVLRFLHPHAYGALVLFRPRRPLPTCGPRRHLEELAQRVDRPLGLARQPPQRHVDASPPPVRLPRAGVPSRRPGGDRPTTALPPPLSSYGPHHRPHDHARTPSFCAHGLHSVVPHLATHPVPRRSPVPHRARRADVLRRPYPARLSLSVAGTHRRPFGATHLGRHHAPLPLSASCAVRSRLRRLHAASPAAHRRQPFPRRLSPPDDHPRGHRHPVMDGRRQSE